MGVTPTQLTENRKNRLAKLFRILTCQMCRSDTHALPLGDEWLGGLVVYHGDDVLRLSKPSIWAVPSYRLLT